MLLLHAIMLRKRINTMFCFWRIRVSYLFDIILRSLILPQLS
uniref:Uncharacterized protein n=1 Tax=Rhizophora mucronata TaxID=61149 RepID=A0A2P2QNN2_RHIMU